MFLLFVFVVYFLIIYYLIIYFLIIYLWLNMLVLFLLLTNTQPSTICWFLLRTTVCSKWSLMLNKKGIWLVKSCILTICNQNSFVVAVFSIDCAYVSLLLLT